MIADPCKPRPIFARETQGRDSGIREGGFNMTTPLALEILLAVHHLISQGISHLIHIKKRQTVQIARRVFIVEVKSPSLVIYRNSRRHAPGRLEENGLEWSV
jgi:hypothetical protein